MGKNFIETGLIELLKTEKKIRKEVKKICIDTISGAILSLEDNQFAQEDIISDLIGLNHICLALELNEYDELSENDLRMLNFVSGILTGLKKDLLN